MANVAFWDDKERPMLLLIDQGLFDALPHGAVLYGLKGNRLVKGVDEFDNDTRAGFLAYGFHLEHARLPDGRYL